MPSFSHRAASLLSRPAPTEANGLPLSLCSRSGKPCSRNIFCNVARVAGPDTCRCPAQPSS